MGVFELLIWNREIDEDGLLGVPDSVQVYDDREEAWGAFHNLTTCTYKLLMEYESADEWADGDVLAEW
tara:strand:- start:723 stop:926 length:204 start_codon:yes stop_codon:yes gene_type:complete